MKPLHKALLILTALFTITGAAGLAQKDTTKYFKNIVKFNITNPMLFSPKFNVIGYERVVNKHQTFSLSAGRFALPTLSFFSEELELEDQYNDKGFNFSVDYRFYLRKENKYAAPRGVYIGPYYAFNKFSRDLLWDVNTESLDGQVTTGFDLTVNLVGAQMGYQFVLWDRFSIDMILMGPGLWFFNLKTNFETTLDPEDEQLLLDTLNEILKEKFPGSDYVFTGGNVEAKKTTNTSTMGLRYMINIGFRF
jgi:hypothetical protein